MNNPVEELVQAAAAAVLVMPEHLDCEGEEECATADGDDRCCAGEVTRLQRAITEVRQSAPLPGP